MLAFTEKQLASAVWNHRSGVNVKRPLLVRSADGTDVEISDLPPSGEIERQAGIDHTYDI